MVNVANGSDIDMGFLPLEFSPSGPDSKSSVEPMGGGGGGGGMDKKGR